MRDNLLRTSRGVQPRSPPTVAQNLKYYGIVQVVCHQQGMQKLKRSIWRSRKQSTELIKVKLANAIAHFTQGVPRL